MIVHGVYVPVTAYPAGNYEHYNTKCVMVCMLFRAELCNYACNSLHHSIQNFLYFFHYASNSKHFNYVTGPAKVDHVSTKKSPIFSVFAVS